jgi:hypothetical protein
MLRISRIGAMLALILAFAVPAAAQTFSPRDAVDSSDYFALVARVDSFKAAMDAKDMGTIMGVVPPLMLEAIAGQYGVTTEQLVAATQEQFDAAMQSVKLVSFGMDLETSEMYRLADDTLYAMIPTETVMDLGDAGGKVRVTSSTLGLLDGDIWYLIRVEDAQQVAILKQVYPAFADVTFPAGSMEQITE